jgi:hypothetical protein
VADGEVEIEGAEGAGEVAGKGEEEADEGNREED